MAASPNEPHSDSVTTTGYWVDAPGRGAIREVVLPAAADGDVLLQAICSGISVGTERLVGLGHVPMQCMEAMACRGMQGSFALPILYGYSFVGTVAHGPDVGRRALVMRPHQQKAIAARTELHWLPESIPAERATLFPNLETARNAVWDAQLEGSESVAIVGAGAVGLLIAFVLSLEHVGSVVVIEQDPARREFAQSLPWVADVREPAAVEVGAFAVAFHTSATAEGLQSAIEMVGFEGHVLELSWYGDRAVNLQLGHSFHYQRKRVSASQVGTVASSQRAGGFGARAEVVMRLLADPQLQSLLGDAIPFADLPDAFATIYRGQSAAPCPVVHYE